MPNKDKIRKLEIRKNGLVRAIHTCGYHKKKIISLIDNLGKLYSNDKISYDEYIRRTSASLDNKSAREWVDYYDEKIRNYNEHIEKINEEITKEQGKTNIAPFVLALTIIVILGAGLLLLRPTITGLIIGENATIEDNISEAITSVENITLPENITILENVTLTVENITNITAVENIPIIKNVTLIIEENITYLLIEKADKPEIRALKKDFRTEEIPKFGFNYPADKVIKANSSTPEQIEAFVFTRNNAAGYIDTKVTKINDGSYEIDLIKNREFRPGSFKLVMNRIVGEDVITQEQNFTWGVLTLNLDKSIYLENEKSFISMAVLDDNGRIICNADVTLAITDPAGKLTTLKTSDDSIKISKECETLGVTELPDYYSTYNVNEAGIYNVSLTTVTNNGIRSINDKIIVQNNVSFDVSRKSATRIYPPSDYVMSIKIKANTNYNGIIREFVPDSFEIKNTDTNVVTDKNNKEKVLSWKVKLKQNDVVELSYTYNAPDVTPEVFLLGPLEISNFRETRQWQLASDAFIFEQTKFWFSQANASEIQIYNGSGHTAENVTVDTSAPLTQLIAMGTTAGVGKYWPGPSGLTIYSTTGNGTFYTPNFTSDLLPNDYVLINGTWEVSIITDCSHNNRVARLNFILFKLNSSGEYNLTAIYPPGSDQFKGTVNGSLADACGTTNQISVNITLVPDQSNTGFTNLTGNDRVGVRISVIKYDTTAGTMGLHYNSTSSYLMLKNVTYWGPSNAPNNVAPIINSTLNLQRNLTTENLTVRFNYSDIDNNVNYYNITWFTNNRSNFTLSNISISNSGIIVETLTHQNTTKYDNWSAQIVVCDKRKLCSNYVNTSQLMIRNSNASITIPAFNQTTFNTLQIINISVVFSDDDRDMNNVTFEWFKNNALIRRTTNSNLANGTNTSDVLTPASFAINDNIIVQAFAFDGEQNSSLKNSTTLTIISANSPPNNPTPLINSTLTRNLTAEDLNVWFTPTDPDAGETLTYDVWAFENGTQLFNINNLPTTQDVLQVFRIDNANTSKGNNYSAQIRICDDSSACSDYVNTSQLNISNSGPQITNVSINPTWSITVNGNTSAFFSFSVRDDDNYTDIDNVNIFANFSRGLETTRYNNTNLDGGCNQTGNFGPNIANYSCTINIVFYDGAGSWNVSVMLRDKSLNYTMNNTATFNLAETTSFSLTDASFTFPDAAPNVFNTTASDAIYMNNTGNDDINASGINITAVNIHGDTLGTTFIPARNFTIANGSIGITDSCDFSKLGVFRLVNKSIDGTTSTNSTMILGTALTAAVKPFNEQTLFLCLLHTPSDLTNQIYSTDTEEKWNIIIS